MKTVKSSENTKKAYKVGTAAKILCLLLVVLSLCPILISCSRGGTSVFTLGSHSINDDVYRYWLSYYKSYYIGAYDDVEDSEEGWQSEISDGVTIEQHVITTVGERMKMYLTALTMFDEYKLSLTSDEKSAVQSQIDKLVESYGGKSKLEASLKSSSNITVATLQEVFTIEKKVSKLNAYLYGENGKTPLTDEQLNSFYKSNYARVKYIYMDKNKEYLYNEDGSIKIGADGNYATVEIDDEKRAELKEKIEKALELAKGGADFNKLISEYNTTDMDYTKDYPDGYTVSSSSYTSVYVYTIVSKALSMEAGDIIFAEDDYAYYVIAKYPLIDGAYKDSEDDQFSAFSKDAAEYYYSELLTSRDESIVTNDDFISKVTINSVGESVKG